MWIIPTVPGQCWQWCLDMILISAPRRQPDQAAQIVTVHILLHSLRPEQYNSLTMKADATYRSYLDSRKEFTLSWLDNCPCAYTYTCSKSSNYCINIYICADTIYFQDFPVASLSSAVCSSFLQSWEKLVVFGKQVDRYAVELFWIKSVDLLCSLCRSEHFNG